MASAGRIAPPIHSTTAVTEMITSGWTGKENLNPTGTHAAHDTEVSDWPRDPAWAIFSLPFPEAKRCASIKASLRERGV
eukprot:1945917-Amphidinium_carterae.1